MKSETEFKINNVSDIKKHYDKYAYMFVNTLKDEIRDYKEKGHDHVICCAGHIFLDKSHGYEEIPNPYRTKSEPTCELGKAMEQAETEANKLGMHIEFVFKSNK